VKKAALCLIIVSVLSLCLYLLVHPGKPVQESLPPGKNIICFGDSLTFGTGSSPGMDYPSQLSGIIGEEVINAGVPGDTTKDAADRLDRDVLSKSPKIVLITLGSNDLRSGVPREEAFKNLKGIVLRIQARGAVVVVGGIDIPLEGQAYREGYKELCRETGALLIPDIYAGVTGRDHLMSDPVHPNDKGYQIIAEQFYAAIKGFL
jgi:acyl-CoA thioesterase I